MARNFRSQGRGRQASNSLFLSSGQEIKREQKKAERRRKQKTATMRKLRAKG